MSMIGVLYKEEATDWAEYFSGVCEQIEKGMLTSLLVGDEDFEGLFRESVTHFQTIMIMMSPGMKNIMLENASILDSVLQKPTVIMMLCGTDKYEFDTTLRGVYPSSGRWNVLEVKDNNDDNDKVAKLILRIANENVDYEGLGRSKFKKHSAKIIPKHVNKPGDKVVIVFNASFSERIYISFSDDPETRYPTRMLNRHTFSFDAPVHKTGTFDLSAYSGAGIIGSWPFTFDTPDVTAYQSVAFLCDVLNVTPGDTVALDAALCEQFNATHPVPGLDNLLTAIVKTLPIGSRSVRRIPSLLHFAALHGLSEFFIRLMDMPGFLRVFEIENSEGKNPADMAEEAGHRELAEYIREFVETQCLSDIYDFSGGYMKMSSITTIYENREEEEKNINVSSDNVYLELAADSVYEDMSAGTLTPAEQDQDSATLRTEPEKRKSQHPNQRQSFIQPRLFEGRVRVLYPPAALGCECQNELIQLQNQVKGNELSIEEALREFQHWKERNEDGSKSFKERKATLDRFRKDCKGELLVIEKGSDNLSDNNPLAKLIRRIRQDQDRPHLGDSGFADEFSPPWRHQRDSAASTSSSSSSYSSASRDSLEYSQDMDQKRSSIPIEQPPPPPEGVNRPAYPLPPPKVKPKPKIRSGGPLNLPQAQHDTPPLPPRYDDQANANVATSPSHTYLPPVPVRQKVSDSRRQPLPSPPPNNAKSSKQHSCRR